MATLNPFDLLGDDDNEDPSQMIVAQQQKLLAPKALPPGPKALPPGPKAQPTPAKLPSKPLPPAQNGSEGGYVAVMGLVALEVDIGVIIPVMKIPSATVQCQLVMLLLKTKMLRILKDVVMAPLVAPIVEAEVLVSVMVRLVKNILVGCLNAEVALGVEMNSNVKGHVAETGERKLMKIHSAFNEEAVMKVRRIWVLRRLQQRKMCQRTRRVQLVNEM